MKEAKIWIVKKGSETYEIFPDGVKPTKSNWGTYYQNDKVAVSLCSYSMRKVFPSKFLPLVKDAPIQFKVTRMKK